MLVFNQVKLYKTISFFLKLNRLFPGARSHSGITDLLSGSNPRADLNEKMDWIEQVLLWLQKGNSESSAARVKYILQILEQNPGWKKNFQKTVEALVAESQFLRFFSYTGYTAEHGLWTDVFERILERTFPKSLSGDFQEVLKSVFIKASDTHWLVNIPPEVLLKIKQLLVNQKNEKVWQLLHRDVQEALLILSANVAHHGLALDIRSRLDQKHSITSSSFLSLGIALQRILFTSNSFLPVIPSQEEKVSFSNGMVRFKTELDICRRDITIVYQKMETSGVSVQVVHKLEMISALLDQMELLLRFEIATDEQTQLIRIRDFLVASARANIRGRSVRAHINRHFYLLSRKIAERNGHSGHGYVARSSKELKSLFYSAVGGGCIVVVMTVLKIFLIRMEPAPLFFALGVWIIYSSGFLSMQFLGCTLATKIPSFTASHLAQVLMATRHSENKPKLGSEVRQIVKSQAIALLGNVAGLIPIVILFNFIFYFGFDQKYIINEHYAKHVLSDLNPFSSLAIFLGALTGILLWASSICGGWFENWLVFRGIPESLAHHLRFKKVFGVSWTKKFAKKLMKHSSGFSSNVALGFFFGFVPFLGTLFGINLDAKHVTISTASATFALFATHFTLSPSDWFLLLIGLALIGLMNFIVSFILALAVAAKAQQLELLWAWQVLVKYIKRRF